MAANKYRESGYGKSIIGSIVGTRKDLADVFALHAAGRTKVIAQERHLDDVNVCIEEVLAGQVPARLVFTSPVEIDALLELPLDAPAEPEVSRDAQLRLELLELLRREARMRPPWQLPPASPLMMWNAR
jgi:hypothetical protein